jgi:sugar phosphate isomerase/epimerase
MASPLSTANLAVQLYTIRDFLTTADDLAQSLSKLSAMGYPAVQLSAVAAMGGESPFVSAAQAKKMLDDNGLKCIATHRAWDDLAHKTEQEIEFHQTLDCNYVAIGSLPQHYRELGAVGYATWIREAQPVIERLKAAGLQFGYHNHAFEFERIQPGAGGSARTFFDILLEEGGPDLLIEMDVYWVDHAGKSADKVIELCHNKLPVVHIKDKEVVDWESVMAPIGEGNLDWDTLLPALAAAGTQWIAIEQDTCRRDPFDCLQSSFEFLKGHPALNG